MLEENPGRQRKRRIHKAKPKAQSDLAKSILNEFPGVNPAVIIKLAEGWNEVVGPELRDHLKMENLSENGILDVSVKEPHWASKVHWESLQLMQRAEKYLGKSVIKEVRVRVLSQ